MVKIQFFRQRKLYKYQANSSLSSSCFPRKQSIRYGVSVCIVTSMFHIRPAKPTPLELKHLSDVDDQEGLRFQVPIMLFYHSNPSVQPKNPVHLIQQALAQALVFYYPFAGRLVEGPNRKLSVNCTGEGVLFTEADADVELPRLGVEVGNPYLAELLHDVPGSSGILGCPLLLIQVTRFRCGGFVVAVRVNHTMSDAPGIVQFLNTVAEFARGGGAEAKMLPTLPPVWKREVLSARWPPRVMCFHQEFEQRASVTLSDYCQQADMVHGTFFFGPKEIRAIQSQLPEKCTIFVALTACLWRTRIRALGFDPDETIHIPAGYYGNAFAYPASVARAVTLATEPLDYAVGLVKAAKAQMSEKYIQSVADFLVTKGRALYKARGNFIVSDTSRAGLDGLDFGWGMPEYGGPVAGTGPICFYERYKGGGADGRVVMLCLPRPAMERFKRELNEITREERASERLIKSSL
ncbi:unnamed protein product [Thlaspi arvense]|uniref:Uncharacterized protein n=1 Tax=Thlaspi arvense TaxID=13288 RepID=A0AAU9SDD7_THLAR|nr:unnamed protein product [Thlaspi arvense]